MSPIRPFLCQNTISIWGKHINKRIFQEITIRALVQILKALKILSTVYGYKLRTKEQNLLKDESNEGTRYISIQYFL